MTSVTNSTYRPDIDGLRASAMPIDKVSSERLGVLRFPLIVGVVFIHAYSTEVSLSNGTVGVAHTGYLVDFVRNLVSQGIARIAVPLFFLMSGYLFFLGFSWSLENYKTKIRSRINTLLVPFLFWNIFTLALLAFAQYLPATQGFFSGKNGHISTFGGYDYLNAIFGIDRYPIAYQFWFIRDLIVLVLFAPVIYLILERAARLFLFVAFVLWFFDLLPIYIPSTAALAFFYAGAYFAYANIGLFTLDRFGFPLLISYTVVVLIDTATKDYAANSYIHNIGILLGIASTLFVTKALVERNNVRQALLRASGCSFFVFAVHEPLLTVVKKISYKVLAPSNDVVVLMLYFFIPALVIASAMLLHASTKSVAPRFLSVISGGR